MQLDGIFLVFLVSQCDFVICTVVLNNFVGLIEDFTAGIECLLEFVGAASLPIASRCSACNACFRRGAGEFE
jgi:hypothetical protein